MRTTIDLDDDVLRALKRRQQSEGKTLGRLVSELLAQVLEGEPRTRVDVSWTTSELRPRVDLGDKDAVWAELDGTTPGSPA